MENVLFKISFPAEFHAQTAVEAAMHAASAGRGPARGRIERIVIETQEPGVRIIDKTGPLANPADRDHCIQYMVAVPLLFGRLTRGRLRGRGRARSARSMRCAPRCRSGRTAPSPATTTTRTSAPSATPCRCSSRTARRARAFRSNIRSATRRRAEGMPVLVKKFETSVDAHFGAKTERGDQKDVRATGRARGDGGEPISRRRWWRRLNLSGARGCPRRGGAGGGRKKYPGLVRIMTHRACRTPS